MQVDIHYIYVQLIDPNCFFKFNSFYRLSVYIARFFIGTFTKLLQVLTEACMTFTSTVERLTNCYAVREWLLPNLNLMQDHSHPHVFRFTKNDEGKMILLHVQPTGCSKNHAPLGRIISSDMKIA